MWNIVGISTPEPVNMIAGDSLQRLAKSNDRSHRWESGVKICAEQSDFLGQPNRSDLVDRPEIGNGKTISVSVRVNLVPMLKHQAVELPVLGGNNLFF